MALSKSTEAPPLHKPPGAFTACRWFFFCATVAIAIGMIALIDKHLTGVKWIYDGPLTQYQGRPITISYCLLSPNADGSVDGNCNFAIAAATVSLALSLIWSYIQVLRRNPFKHSKAKLADLAICVLAALFWAAAGVVLCLFTDRANKAGLPESNSRNGLCVMAWALFLAFAFLSVMSLLLVTRRSQKLFDKWAAKHELKKQQKKEAKMQKLSSEETSRQQAAAAAASQTHQAVRPQAVPQPAGPAAVHAPAQQPVGGAVAGPQQVQTEAAAVADTANPFLADNV